MEHTKTHTNKTILRIILAAAAVLLLCGAAAGAGAGAAAALLMAEDDGSLQADNPAVDADGGDGSGTEKVNYVTIKDSTDKTEYDTIALAADAHGDSGTTYVIHGTLKYDMPNIKNGSYTFEGADANATLDMSLMGTYSQEGMSLTFKNLKYYKAPTKPYEGLAHAAAETYVNCIIECEWRTYGETMTFTGCTFLPPKDTEGVYESAYNVFIYGSTTVTFDTCNFTSTGKAIKVFSEHFPGIRKTISIKNCTFTIDEDHKKSGSQHPAVQINCYHKYGDGSEDGGAYDVTIENCTATGFTISDPEDGATYLPNTLWGDWKDEGKKMDQTTGKPYLDLIVKSPVTVDKNIQHGSISVDKTVGTSHVSAGKVTAGSDTITVTAVPEAGYRLESVTVTSGEYSSVTIPVTISGNTATFAMYPWPVTVSAVMAAAKIKTATASAPDFVYNEAGIKSVPSLDDPSITGQSYFYSTSAEGPGLPWDDGKVLNAGTYYVYAELDGDESKRSSFKVLPAEQEIPEFSVEVTGAETVVTIDPYNPEKPYEYKLAAADENTENDPWITVLENPFTISGLKASTTYTIDLRVKATADGNYKASDAASESFITTGIFSVVYNANRGLGEVPQTQESRTQVTAASPDKLYRPGYTFSSWNTQPDGTGTSFYPGDTVREGAVLYAQWAGNPYTVSFDANGGEGTMTPQVFTYGEDGTLSENRFTYDGRTFAGWAERADGPAICFDGQTVNSLTTDPEITLYAVWVDTTYEITVNVTGAKGDVTLTLKRGNAVIEERSALSTAFTGVPAGIYTLVAYDKEAEKTVTERVDVDTNKNVEVVFPAENVNSVLHTEAAVVAGGLDAEAVSRMDTDGKKTTVTLTAEAKVMEELADTASEEEKEVQGAIALIQDAESGKTHEYINFTVTREVEGDQAEQVKETNNVIQLIVFFDLNGKENITVSYVHNGKYEPMIPAPDKMTKEPDTYFVDYAENIIYINTNKFSVYAASYTTPGHKVTIEPREHGAAAASKTTGIAKGEGVLLTANPDNGYKLSRWDVLSGEVEEWIGDNLFLMPDSDVVIAPVWEKERSSSSSSPVRGTSIWLTPTPTVTPAPTPAPAGDQPEAVSPVKPIDTPSGSSAKTPAPFLGILAGLGAAAVVFGLRRK